LAGDDGQSVFAGRATRWDAGGVYSSRPSIR